jgi:phosphoglycerol transferase MdoB-like AlkP superfamily enzyme
MKERINSAISGFIMLNLAFLPMIPLLRLYEYFFLKTTPEFPKNAFAIEMTGMIHDLMSLLVFVLVLIIPFILIFLWRRKVAEIFYICLLCLLTLLQLSIIKFFSITLSPLDEVIFSFSLKENLLIIGTSDVNFLSFLPLIAAVLLVIFLQFIFRKITLRKSVEIFVGGFICAVIIFSIILPSGKASEEPLFSYYMRISKCGYFVERSVVALFSRSSESERHIKENVEKYHSLHPEFNFTGNKYPLLHSENTPDVLSPFFNLSTNPPNLVFIIVESLSAAHVGDSSWYGNFTPFLDSLKNHSLYWENFLSTSERTFHVLQALFGSLPYGKGDFQKDMAVMPSHFSLIRSLRENGYFAGFYYGGDATFTNYDQFLRKQGLDYQLHWFGPKYSQQLLEYKDFRWGYQDGAVFERTMEVLDSLKKEPRIDIYLTLSTHFPFQPPNADYYLAKAQKIMDDTGFSNERRIRSAPFKKLFSSVLYTDDAIKALIKAYSERPDYQNTIFIITGDHSFTEFGNMTISAIEHYHVPMIIYSPMLKRAKHFRSVSSHLDITPSFLAMLNPAYHFRSEKYTHWLGQGLDTVAEFRNTHTMAFTKKSNKTTDYLKGDYYFSENLLYKIGEGLKTIPVNDEGKNREMSSDLKATFSVFTYTNQHNLLIPPDASIPLRQEEIPVKLNDQKVLRANSPDQEYLSFITPAEIPSKFRTLAFDIRFRYMINSAADTSGFPSLAATVENKNFKMSLYHLMRFPDVRTNHVKPSVWNPIRITENLDVSMIDSLTGQYVKIYFYYHKPCSIQVDSLQIHVKGIK